MAITQNKYTGDGSTVLYSFTFPYLEVADIKVSLDGVDTTAYTLANATQIRFNAAPANGVAIRLYRQTDDENLAAQFFPGSAIRAKDLNDNFTQNLYVTQESGREAAGSINNANEALAKANTALSTANTAISDAATATSIANSSVSDAAAAVVIANAADVKAGTAITAANSAESKANTALSAITNVVQYTPIVNVAAIPGSPADATFIEITDSTGIEGFTPLQGVPGGYVGDAGLSVRLTYSSSGGTWKWISYSPNDPEDRYQPKVDMTAYLLRDISTLAPLP
jgi:hypothetical protein